MGAGAVRRVRGGRALAIAAGVLVALALAAVAALGAGGEAGPAGAEAGNVAAEAALHGLDPELFAAVVAADAVSYGVGGRGSELRAAAQRLRGAIDRHGGVVAALAASRVGDERVAGWISANPALVDDPSAVPDAAARAYVRDVLAEDAAGAGI